MNSLVVLFSVLALASASPSGAIKSYLGYTGPVAAVVPDPRAILTLPVAAAPAAVSHQSRIDIKSTPGLVSTYAAAPYAYGPALVNTYAAGPLFPSPLIGSPVAALASPAVPLDTPEVIAARAAHLQAKALDGAHSINKRSAPLIATSPLISTYSAPLAYSHAPLPLSPLPHYSYPIIPKTYGFYSW